jgi:hypothetical protein
MLNHVLTVGWLMLAFSLGSPTSSRRAHSGSCSQLERAGTLTMTIHLQLGDLEPEPAFSEKLSSTGLIYNMSEEMSEEFS